MRPNATTAKRYFAKPTAPEEPASRSGVAAVSWFTRI